MTSVSKTASPGSGPGARPADEAVAPRPVSQDEQDKPGLQKTGLREKNKARTRAAIREAALDLMYRNGFEATTVAQIAEAAHVSHTTFFRYFQTKEQVIVSDDNQAATDAKLALIPPGLGRFELLRRMVTDLFEIGARDPWVSDPRRKELLRNDPILRMAYHAEAEQNFARISEFFADYAGLPQNALKLRVFVGAMAGAFGFLIEKSDSPDEELLDQMLAAIDLMEAGLPL